MEDNNFGILEQTDIQLNGISALHSPRPEVLFEEQINQGDPNSGLIAFKDNIVTKLQSFGVLFLASCSPTQKR